MAEDVVPVSDVETLPAVPEPLAPAATTAPPAPRPNYHVSVWDEPAPMYVCLLCPSPPLHMTLEDIEAHMPEVHNQDAVPTETTPFLLSIRVNADAEALAKAQAAVTPTPEEVDHGGGTATDGGTAPDGGGAPAASPERPSADVSGPA